LRLTYFDDAGLFNSQHEPFIVIGGMVVHGDDQLIPLENRLDELVEKHISIEDRNGFIFHAMEIWSGGRYFNRDKWSFETRVRILDDLVSIPNDLEIPVSFGYQNRQHAWRFIDPKKNDRTGN
jgi:hypothetical protein